MYIHIGIYYPKSPELELPADKGKLVLFKHRLPPSWTEDDGGYRLNLQPLLTEEELNSVFKSRRRVLAADDPFSKLKPENLGGLGCCDCCHLRCNVGAKFPNLTRLNYMMLTPQL